MAENAKPERNAKADEAPKRFPLDHRVPLKGRLVLAALLPLGYGAFWLAGQFPELTESAYGGAVFPAVRGVLSAATGWAPFAIGEWIVALAIVVVTVAVVRESWHVIRRRRSLRNALGHLLTRTLAALGLLYALFLLLFGFAYQRPALTERAEVAARLESAPIAVDELQELAVELALRARRLRSGVDLDEAGRFRLDPEAAPIETRAGAGYVAVNQRFPELAADGPPAKRVLLSPLMSRVLISGIYFPLTGEANVNTEVPDVARPFVVAHELAHQRGIAREDEANYIAWLACSASPDADVRYSGAAMALRYALISVNSADPAAAQALAQRVHELAPEVYRDQTAYSEWVEQHRTAVSETSRAMNDTYLRANAQRGVVSYSEMTRLLVADRRAGRLFLFED